MTAPAHSIEYPRYLSHAHMRLKYTFLMIAVLCLVLGIWLLATIAHAQVQQSAGFHPAPRTA